MQAIGLASSIGFHLQWGMANGLECILDIKASLGEGVFWSVGQRKIFWVDINAGILYRFDPESGLNESVSLGKKIGAAVECHSGRLLLGLEDGIYSLDFQSRNLEKWNDPLEGATDNRFNDGKVGPDGRFYIGGLGPERKQKLFRIDSDKSFCAVEDGITISNGLVWSLDESTLYYIDTTTLKVVAYDFDSSKGSLSNRRTIIEVEEVLGWPDGMTIDSQGMLWVAHWNGSCLRRWDPDTGKELDRIDLPVSRVTCCAFGGADLKDLYITTASEGMDDGDWNEQPMAGGLFRCRTQVAGVLPYRFRDL